MKESKTIRVSPYEAQTLINKYENFGWELKSNQSVHYSEPKTSSSFINGVYIHESDSYDYLYLTFQRNTKIPNYLKIVDLENQYDDLNEQLKEIEYPLMPKKSDIPLKKRRKGKIVTFFGALLLISGIYFPIAKFVINVHVDMPGWQVIVFSIVYIILGWLLLGYGVSSIQSYTKEAKASEEEYEKQKISVEKKKKECYEAIKSIEKQIKDVSDKAWMLVDL